MTVKNTLTALFFILACFTVHAQHVSDTLYAKDYGLMPWSFNNQTENFQKVISVCKSKQAKVLVLESGRYDIWPEGAVRKEVFITNTSTEQECPSKVKTFGVLFEDMDGLTVEGNGSTLMFHGKQTMISFMHCKNMMLRNLHIDFERPGGSELTISKVDENGVEVAFHRDSRYVINNGRIYLIGEGWKTNKPHCIEYNPKSERFFYSAAWGTLSKSEAVEIKPGVVRFKTPANFKPIVGDVLTIRDIIRDQVGFLIYESNGVTLENVGVHYMHGLGIVSQYSRDITMKNVSCTPVEGSGRILASSADFMHFSGCSGKVSVVDCKFAGAQDDCINVHGTNLRAVEKVDDNTLKLRFMHGQSYGYNAFFVGDTVAFVHASAMERFDKAIVTKVTRLSDRLVQVSFNRAVPQALELNHDCVENLTCTPEVEIRNNYFTRTSTRGTLVTTPRKVVIENNVYYKTGMSAILIEGDAEGWYESGPVNDVTIRNNVFIECAYNGAPGNAVIALNPSNTIIDSKRPVHRNVCIENNRIVTWGNPLLYAKSTADLRFIQNKVENKKSDSPLFILNGCKNVSVKKNTVQCETETYFKVENMKKNDLHSDLRR